MSGGTATGRRRWIPLWVLQVMELAVALVFVDVSIHVADGGLLVAAAVAFTALAVTVQGPLGIFRLCRPPLHLTLLIAVAAVVAVTPVLPMLRPDIEGIIVVEFGAVGLIRLATLTEMVPSSRSRLSSARRRDDDPVIDATASVTPDGAAPGRAAPPSSTGAAARWAGRAAGAASVSGRRAVARHRPEAEAQVKRALRGAGRLTGRVTSSGDRGRSGGQPGAGAGDTAPG
jgi:hypothetical protein